MPISEIEELLLTYKKEEEIIDSKLELNDKAGHRIDNKKLPQKVEHIPSIEEAKERNKSILKDLEIVKGNLRSKAIFSPTEMQWKKLIENYKSEPALAVKKWRCDIPIYV